MAALSLSCSAAPQSASPQGDAGNERSTPQVTMVRLVPPAYPSMAVVARIEGNVNLKVAVRPDGSVASVTAISGVHPVLTHAAVESAKQSQFACRNCNDVIEQSLIYTFQLPGSEAKADPCCCSSGHQPPTPIAPQVSDDFHITITATPLCVCPDACTIANAGASCSSRHRSAKCLYLWKCGTRHYVAAVE